MTRSRLHSLNVRVHKGEGGRILTSYVKKCRFRLPWRWPAKKRRGKKRVGALLWKILECQRRHRQRVSIGLKGKVLGLNYVNEVERDWLSSRRSTSSIGWEKCRVCNILGERRFEVTMVRLWVMVFEGHDYLSIYLFQTSFILMKWRLDARRNGCNFFML